jgi:hypothetical protein
MGMVMGNTSESWANLAYLMWNRQSGTGRRESRRQRTTGSSKSSSPISEKLLEVYPILTIQVLGKSQGFREQGYTEATEAPYTLSML